MAGLSNRVVFLPPADRADLYDRLPSDLDGVKMHRFRAVRFYEDHAFEGPTGVLYGNRMVVSPDVVFKGPSQFLYLPTDGGPPQVLHPITKTEFDKRASDPTVLRMTTAEGFVIPPSDTGRLTENGK